MADAPLDQVEAFKAYILARYPLSAPALLRSIELKDARIAELVAANEMLSRSLDESLFCNVQGIAESLAAQPQPPAAPLTPLSDEQIEQLLATPANLAWLASSKTERITLLIRAVERAHGITTHKDAP